MLLPATRHMSDMGADAVATGSPGISGLLSHVARAGRVALLCPAEMSPVVQLLFQLP